MQINTQLYRSFKNETQFVLIFEFSLAMYRNLPSVHSSGHVCIAPLCLEKQEKHSLAARGEKKVLWLHAQHTPFTDSLHCF